MTLLDDLYYQLKSAKKNGGSLHIEGASVGLLHDEIGKLLLVPSKETIHSHTNAAQALLDKPDAAVDELKKALETQIHSVRHYAYLARIAEEDHGQPVYCIFMEDSPYPMVCCSTDPDVELRIAEQVTALLWLKGIRAGSDPNMEIQQIAMAKVVEDTSNQLMKYLMRLIKNVLGVDALKQVAEAMQKKGQNESSQ